jgi:hypothetical protein
MISPAEKSADVGIIIGTLTLQGVRVFDAPNYGGRSKILGVGGIRFFSPDDFNDVISSVQVGPGYVAILYEHADEGGGFGRSIDLLEDCPNLSKYGFDKQTSYINVFAATRGPFIWIRNSLQNGQFTLGHWERQPASGAPPANPEAVVSLPLPPAITMQFVTTIQVSGADSIIQSLANQSDSEAQLWEYARQNQAGALANDYRGIEPIGSAAFERASNNVAIPDSFNFWYPQRQPHDHRGADGYFKRVLVGTIREVHIAAVDGTYEDHDVNIDIVPNPEYQYLLTDAHPREYTSIMSAEWHLSLHKHGQPSCNDAASVAEFEVVEAEIQADGDIHSAAAQRLNDGILRHGLQEIGVYGPWIYDRGHCCHAEIHPAEQIWWRDNDLATNQSKYSFNVFCDASGRFWWRDQMDDGLKLKPWGAPPITGVFAIPFEADLGKGVFIETSWPFRTETKSITYCTKEGGWCHSFRITMHSKSVTNRSASRVTARSEASSSSRLLSES